MVPIAQFIDGYRHTVCAPDELVTAILVPRPPDGARGDFIKLGARRYLVISIVMAAAVLATDAAGTVIHARVAVGACSAVAQRLPQLEQALLGQPLAAAPDLVAAGHLAPLSPIDDVRGSGAFRAAAAVDVVRDLLAGLAGQSVAERRVMLDKVRQAGATTVRFSVNGEAVAVSADPFASLASTLRDRLGLTGTKIGCDAGDCGACTVLIDGRQACACLTATGQAEGAAIHTVEGPGPEGLTDRLRRAFLAHGAAQCGICTPGMLMAAADCLSRTPRADARARWRTRSAACCAAAPGYIKIVEAVMEVAGGVRPCAAVRPQSTTRSERGV